ncbi:hypothetical protein H4R35_006677 [Dimargaris xerosporica]|nr:hypothetical protein H4R35_006677 [Dimargaris xerosporica]
MSTTTDMYEIITPRVESLSPEEMEALLQALQSIIPVPNEVEEEASNIQLPKPVVCQSHCSNPKDVAQAMQANISVIHVPPQAQPLQRQIKRLQKKLHENRKGIFTALGKSAVFGILAHNKDTVKEVGNWVADQAPALESLANWRICGYRLRNIAIGGIAAHTMAMAVHYTLTSFHDGADGWSHLLSYELVPVKQGNQEDLYLVHKEHRKRSQAKSDSIVSLLRYNPLTSWCESAHGSNIPMVVYSSIVAGILATSVKSLGCQ